MKYGRFYPEEVIEELIERNDMVDTVSGYVKLIKKGKDYFGLCPFHREKTPSFSVVPSKQIFYCFGCGKGGNVIHFIKNIENIEYADAIHLLAERSSYILPESQDDRQMQREQRDRTLIQINTEAARFFFSLFKTEESMEARKYLTQRGVELDTVKKFAIGYASADMHQLSLHLRKQGYRDEDIIEAGLAFRNKDGEITDRFRNRIIFPIFDIRKRIIGFGGRIISGTGAKYMNSPETPVYQKSSSLYGIHIAKDDTGETMVVVEGYMDCIALHQAGIGFCVASLGTSLSQRQARILKKMSQEVIISYDSDAAGQAAALRGLDLLSDMGVRVKILMMDEGKDPDDYICTHGVERYRELIKQAMPLVEYKAHLIKKKVDMNTTDGVVQFLNEMAKSISKVDNEMEKEKYIQKISRDYMISEQALMDETRKYGVGLVQPVQSSIRLVPKKKEKTEDAKKRRFFTAVAIACQKPILAENLAERMDPSFLDEELFRQMFDGIRERVHHSKGVDDNYILTLLDESDASLFSGVSATVGTSKDMDKALEAAISSYKEEIVKKRIESIAAALTRRNLDFQEEGQLQTQLLENMALLKKMKQ